MKIVKQLSYCIAIAIHIMLVYSAFITNHFPYEFRQKKPLKITTYYPPQKPTTAAPAQKKIQKSQPVSNTPPPTKEKKIARTKRAEKPAKKKTTPSTQIATPTEPISLPPLVKYESTPLPLPSVPTQGPIASSPSMSKKDQIISFLQSQVTLPEPGKAVVEMYISPADQQILWNITETSSGVVHAHLKKTLADLSFLSFRDIFLDSSEDLSVEIIFCTTD